MRAGGCLRVVLYAENRPAAVPHPFERVVVQIDVRRLQVARQRVQIDCEAVILRGYRNRVTFARVVTTIRT